MYVYVIVQAANVHARVQIVCCHLLIIHVHLRHRPLTEDIDGKPMATAADLLTSAQRRRMTSSAHSPPLDGKQRELMLEERRAKLREIEVICCECPGDCSIYWFTWRFVKINGFLVFL